MSGNVEEWCLNAYDDLKGIDLSGSARRVVRGGAWYLSQFVARAAFRSHVDPAFRSAFWACGWCVRPPFFLNNCPLDAA